MALRTFVMSTLATAVFFVAIVVLAWGFDRGEVLQPYGLRLPVVRNDIGQLYGGNALSARAVVRYLLLADPIVLTPTRIAVVLVCWFLGWLLGGSLSRRFRDVVLGLILSYIVLIFYLSLVNVRVVLYVPESFLPIPVALAGAWLGQYLVFKLRRFDLFAYLEKHGVRVEPAYKNPIKLPFRCPKCGALIASNAQFCWRCGSELVSYFASER